ncbi:RRS1-domain-containing protein [Multifurca ochricompacta]|uniref:Ribosome biogenesis regulatory protein n=1 Tax=Multifurca ochricompacta TaxID=376703 RepID=A0AAD4QIT0_9AGAM|nr:RRS1-domain-containing protein [Multifurca ochricompacta]
MDVSDILASQASKNKSILVVEKDIPPDVDAGFLTVTDLNVIDKESYDHERETYLQSTARDSVQLLLSSLFSLPTLSSPEGPFAQLPTPTTQLPRAKPLPKPKPLTKWERFARAKGIHSQKRDKKVWDEERQAWVPRWGWKGKNKEEEAQWLHEVPANADADYDPAKDARVARKARAKQNERQHLQNLARGARHQLTATANYVVGTGVGAGMQTERKKEIDRTLATTRVSTASMGKFNRALEGEKKLRGVKRKFDPIERSVETEKSASLALIKKLGNDVRGSSKFKKDGDGDGKVLNVRKAVRFASGGRGAVSLALKTTTATQYGSDGKGKRKMQGKGNGRLRWLPTELYTH